MDLQNSTDFSGEIFVEIENHSGSGESMFRINQIKLVPASCSRDFASITGIYLSSMNTQYCKTLVNDYSRNPVTINNDST